MIDILKNKIGYEVMAIFLAIWGIILGIYFPQVALSISFIGEIFILLLKMMIIPLVVTSIFLSIAKLKVGELKSLGGKTLSYYLFTSFMAAFIGILLTNFFEFSNLNHLDSFKNYDSNAFKEISFSKMIVSFFSGNFFNALTEGNIVQIVVFTLIVGMASIALEASHKNTLVNFAESVQELMMKVINWIVKIAPIGVFSLIATIMAKSDPQIFKGLGTLFLIIFLSVLFHCFVTLGALAYFVGKVNIFSFIISVKKALLVALTTASSTATLPISTKVLNENVGVSKKTSGFVLPLGATLNMDGSALYQAVVVLFLGEFAGMDFTLSQQILVFFFVMTASAGTAGIPGGGLMMFGATLEMVGIPLEYIGIYLLIDRVWDYPITMVNVFGDLVGAKTVDRFIS